MLISKGLGKEPRPWRKPDNKPFPVDDVWAERLLNSGLKIDPLREASTIKYFS